MFDGIEFRGSAHENVEILARYAGVPVWNGLTDTWHPTQMLADVLRMRDHSTKPFDEVAYCYLGYLGDARNNTANSLLVTGALLAVDVRLAAPEALLPSAEVREIAERLATARVRDSCSPLTTTRQWRAPTSSTPASGSRWANRRRNGASASPSPSRTK
jgi:ornithine carbamoyltransferase